MDGTITEGDLAQHIREMLGRVHMRGECLTPGGATYRYPEAGAGYGHMRTLAKQLATVGFPGDGFTDGVKAVQMAQPCLEPPAWPS